MVDINEIIAIAEKAGKDIMEIYAQDFDVAVKGDESPLTQADLAAHTRIVSALAKLTPDIPLLSEESVSEEVVDRLTWSRYWLIDPLDGTKEFIKKNGEFTVNIALIDNHQPILGVVHAPALQLTYWGVAGEGASKRTADGKEQRITVQKPPTGSAVWRVVGSRSHQSDEFKKFMECLPGAKIVAMGSSLKLCSVAEGKADLYPRLGLTSEWDTAAAQAVVEAAGGQVLEYPNMQPMRCNTRKETLLNPHFIVCARPAAAWASVE